MPDLVLGDVKMICFSLICQCFCARQDDAKAKSRECICAPHPSCFVDPLLLDMPRTRAMRRSRLALRHRNPYRKLSKEEIRLAEMWHKDDGMEPSEIGQLLRRDK